MNIVNLKQLKNYVVCESCEKIAVCILDNRGSFDYENKSGALTKMLKKLNTSDFEDIEKYFQIVENPFYGVKGETECRICGELFKTNRDGSLTRHLRDIHGISIRSYLEQYPEESKNFPLHASNISRENFINEDISHYIECPVCGERMKKITRSHIEFRHGMTVEEFKQETNLFILSSEKTRNKSQKLYHDRNENISTGFNKVSKEEQELRDFIKELTPNLDLNRRKYLDGVEIDIYLPELSLGIEYNGLYYHSDANMGKGRQYHLNKTLLAEKHGIHLIQIFSDEWKFKKNIVKSKLRRIISKQGEVLYARKCSIRQIDSKECNRFLKENHIQGACAATYRYGAFFQDSLVAVATFSKPRLSTNTSQAENSMELVRMCGKEGVTVVGILPKFIKSLQKEVSFQTLYSYADRRWTYINSNIYLKTGFKLVGISAPSYWYTRYFDIRYHRYTFAKYKIRDKEWFDPDKTEWENMRSQKFDRIWDCGNLKYEWKHGSVKEV